MEMTINGCVSPLDIKNTTDANAATVIIPQSKSKAIRLSLLILEADLDISEKHSRLTIPQTRQRAHLISSFILVAFS